MRAARRPQHRPPERTGAVPRARRFALGLLAALAAVVIPPAFPADRDAEQREADAQQTLAIRRAFSGDSNLSACPDVRVSVRGTTARLWGTVPSAALKQRALFVARQVRGVAEVNGDDLLAAQEGSAGLPSPFPEGVPPRGTPTGNRRDGHTTEAPKKAEVPDPDPAPLHEAVTLLPPVPLTAPADKPPVEILPPRPLPAESDLAAAVEAIRGKDERFRQVKAEVRRKAVYLRGTVRRWDDVNDLANAVRRLPGVEAVILDGVQVGGGPRGR